MCLRCVGCVDVGAISLSLSLCSVHIYESSLRKCCIHLYVCMLHICQIYYLNAHIFVCVQSYEYEYMYVFIRSEPFNKHRCCCRLSVVTLSLPLSLCGDFWRNVNITNGHMHFQSEIHPILGHMRNLQRRIRSSKTSVLLFATSTNNIIYPTVNLQTRNSKRTTIQCSFSAPQPDTKSVSYSSAGDSDSTMNISMEGTKKNNLTHYPLARSFQLSNKVGAYAFNIRIICT